MKPARTLAVAVLIVGSTLMIHESGRAEPIASLQFINPPDLYDPRPNAYYHLAVFPAGWRIILPAGEGGENAQGELPPSFAEQLRQALDNTETVLAAAGASMSDVAKFNLLIVDHSEEKFDAIREEFERVWGETKPAWMLIFVPALALEGMRTQVDDGPVRVFRAGQAWFESLGARHSVSANASYTEPARLIAVIVVDAGDDPIVIPDPH